MSGFRYDRISSVKNTTTAITKKNNIYIGNNCVGDRITRLMMMTDKKEEKKIPKNYHSLVLSLAICKR